MKKFWIICGKGSSTFDFREQAEAEAKKRVANVNGKDHLDVAYVMEAVGYVETPVPNVEVKNID